MQLYTPLCWSIGPSVGPSVCPSHFTFLALMGVLAFLLLPKCSTDLNYGPCPPARNWSSRVSGLVFFYLMMVLFKMKLAFVIVFLQPKLCQTNENGLVQYETCFEDPNTAEKKHPTRKGKSHWLRIFIEFRRYVALV